MGNANCCLKCLFISFNIFLGILGVILLISAIKTNPIRQAGIDAASQDVAGLWVCALATLLLAILGIVGACTEKSILLKVFCGLLLIEVVVLVIIGIIVASTKSKVKDFISTSSAELMKNEELQGFVKGLQAENKCCGLTSYKDWAGAIPDSCSCQSGVTSDCMQVEDKQIYKQACLGFFIYYIDLVLNISLGLAFGVAAFELAGCGLIIRAQMSLQYADLRDFHSVAHGTLCIHGFGGAMILLCGLRVWRAYKERSCILGMYIGGKVTGVIVLLILGIKVAYVAPVIRSAITEYMDGLQRAMKSNMEVQRQVKIVELQFECCGLNHYADWGSNVPQSCQCPSQYQNTDRCTTVIAPFDYDVSYMFLLLLPTFAVLCVIKKKDEAVCVTEEALPISLNQDPRFWLYPQVLYQRPNLTFYPPPYSLLSAHSMPGSPIQNKVFA